MKCVKRLTADQQRLAEENLTIVERVLRFDINANPCVAGLGYEDLYQEGCVWLCNAALTFDPARGSFASYARQVVQNGLVSYCRNLTGKQGKLKSVLSRSYFLCSCCPMRFWKSMMASARTVSL